MTYVSDTPSRPSIINGSVIATSSIPLRNAGHPYACRVRSGSLSDPPRERQCCKQKTKLHSITYFVSFIVYRYVIEKQILSFLKKAYFSDLAQKK